MSKDLIRYDLLVQEALKGVVRKVLGDAVKDGLPGDHHFYVSFRTDFPGVRVSSRLREKYPQDMTIVIQHQFWDLSINETGFEVGLSFSGVPERLLVPFDAVTGFFDPSVQFGLKFEIEGEAAAEEITADPSGPAGKRPEVGVKKSSVPALKSATPALPARPAEVGKPGGKRAKIEVEKRGEEPPAAGAEVVSLDAFRKKS